MNNFGRFKSIYEQNQRTNVALGDYTVPAKSMNTMLSYEYSHKPQLFNSTKLGRDQQRAIASGQEIKKSTSTAFATMTLSKAGETVAKNANPTSHWKPTYKETVETVDAAEKIKSRRPLWSINRTAYSSNRGTYQTEFADSFGAHGHNPRTILDATSAS